MNIDESARARTIRVLLAEDEHLIRDALAAILELETDIEITARAATGQEALATAVRHRPDVAVLDLQLPDIGGLEVAERLATDLPECRMLVVTSHGRPGYLKKALSVGVLGFLPKTVRARVLAEAIRAVRDGRRYVDPELAGEAIGAGDSPLTPRESDVLEYAANGAGIEEIARRAALTVGTTRNYLSSATSKIGAANRHEACAIARRHGWI
ncbi:two component transcriptional regulator, LuxR family [Haloechinothrix alba]|uniref:Two component transcriptional regulator, LuxR family n=1 Tax=Haloechinothrix alba TaxID=664784 RepID=A0A238VET2_9PSEU|nr:response regulator transcription factor [Haloechinothrix alba]SNR32664.1 two component transcriptional regulator, LuxR family [Haloechinothrix alba]